MREGWEQVPLAEVIRVHHGWAFPSSGCRPPNRSSPRLIRIGDFARTSQVDFRPSGVQSFVDPYPDRFLLAPGTLLMAMTCQSSDGEILGVTMRVPRDESSYLHNQRIGRIEVIEGSRLRDDFLEYAFRAPEFSRHLFVTASGSKILHTSPERITSYLLPLPPISEQRRIAGVLGALDDLIETNQRVCAAIAQLSRDLFSVLLPESAVVTRLGDIAAVNPDAIKPGAGDIRYLDIAALRDGGMDEPRCVSWSEAPSRARRGAVGKDILWSTVRPNRRGHTLLLESHDDLVVSTGIAVIRAQEIGFAQLYASTDRPEFVDFLMGRAEGSAYPAVRPLDIEAAPIPVLGSSAAARYEAVMAPLWEAVGKLTAEKEQARQTRDELLQLLMSGAVSPGEIEVAS